MRNNGQVKWVLAVFAGAIIVGSLKVLLDFTMADTFISIEGARQIPVVFGWQGTVHSGLRTAVDMLFGYCLAMLWMRWVGAAQPRDAK